MNSHSAPNFFETPLIFLWFEFLLCGYIDTSIQCILLELFLLTFFTYLMIVQFVNVNISLKRRYAEVDKTQWAETWKKILFQMCVLVVAQLPQRLKSTVFWNFFFTPGLLRGLSNWKNQKHWFLAFEANGALSCQNGVFPNFSSLCKTHTKI